MVWSGTAWQGGRGGAGPGVAWPGEAWPGGRGKARRGVASLVKAWQGELRHGIAW